MDMDTGRPPQRPEGKVIADAAEQIGTSVRQLAAKAGISDTRWRQIVSGTQPTGRGQYLEIIAPAKTLARMAQAVELGPEDLEAAGRSDAADELRRLIERAPSEMSGGANALIREINDDPRVPEERKRALIRLIRQAEASAEAERQAARDELERWHRSG